jgi:hypothetical protein
LDVFFWRYRKPRRVAAMDHRSARPEECFKLSGAVEEWMSGPGVHVAEEFLECEVGWGPSADVKCMVVTQAPNRMNSTPSTLGRLRISRMSRKESCGALFSELGTSSGELPDLVLRELVISRLSR